MFSFFLFSAKVTSDYSDSSSTTESDLSTASASTVSSLLPSPNDVVPDLSIDTDSTEPGGFLYTELKALPSSACKLPKVAKLISGCCD